MPANNPAAAINTDGCAPESPKGNGSGGSKMAAAQNINGHCAGFENAYQTMGRKTTPAAAAQRSAAGASNGSRPAARPIASAIQTPDHPKRREVSGSASAAATARHPERGSRGLLALA